MIMTNFMMNVAAIAISPGGGSARHRPVSGRGGEVILFAALVTAGVPFLLLVGAAPQPAEDRLRLADSLRPLNFSCRHNAGQYLADDCHGIYRLFLWPLMGMPVTVGG